jgi:hypothetical protein
MATKNGRKSYNYHNLDIFRDNDSKFHTIMQKHKRNRMEYHVPSFNGQIQDGG